MKSLGSADGMCFLYVPSVSYSHSNSSRYIDPRTRTDRIENESHHWDIQIDLLVEAYLDYRHRNSGDGIPQVDEIPLSPSDYDDQHISLGQIEFIDIFSTYFPCYLLLIMYLYRKK
jgi:hypothetical protein